MCPDQIEQAIKMKKTYSGICETHFETPRNPVDRFGCDLRVVIGRLSDMVNYPPAICYFRSSKFTGRKLGKREKNKNVRVHRRRNQFQSFFWLRSLSTLGLHVKIWRAPLADLASKEI